MHLGETMIQGCQETLGNVTKNYSQSLCMFLSLSLFLPHLSGNLPNACDVSRVWGQRGVCVIRLLLLLLPLLLLPLQLMNISANEAKEPPPMLRFCVMNSGSKCVVLITTFKQFVFVCLFDWSEQHTSLARPNPKTVACVCSRKPNTVIPTFAGT